MRELLIGALVWVAVFVLLAWQLRRRRDLYAREGDPEERLGLAAGGLPMLLARPRKAEDAADADDDVNGREDEPDDR